jgi:hypothetical protein
VTPKNPGRDRKAKTRCDCGHQKNMHANRRVDGVEVLGAGACQVAGCETECQSWHQSQTFRLPGVSAADLAMMVPANGPRESWTSKMPNRGRRKK